MKKIFTLCVVLCLSYLTMGASTPKHEFRATWLATVSGIDWPKTKATNDATREQQKQELIDILDKMKAGNLNAVCFQVRSLCDAMYQSSYEPWSIALTGTRGKDPGYDPLQFAIDEAHKRGMELHVWVNPFRASTSTLAATDMLWDNAGDWLIKYNNSSFSGYLIDPGYPESRAYVVKVLMEIINNYDVDGLVMDDYFYAYGGTTNQDSVAQALHYRASEVIDVNNNGNKIDDWRRSNVDNVIKAMYDSIQVVKPWVRFGMGPGGIWTTDSKAASAYGISLPSGISGSDIYNVLYCNTVEWIKGGYVDYVNPQIYWSTQVAAQDYDVLCQWWSTSVCEHFSNQLPNQKRVHHFPSLATYKAIQKNDGTYYSGYSDGYVEIQRELDANRKNLSSGYTGAVFYNTTSYLQMSEELAESHFTHTALAPPMEWKVKGDLAAPTNLQLSGTTLSWQHPTAERFTVYAYPKGIGVNTATSNPQYLQAVVYDKSFNTSSIGSLDDITIAVYTYDRYGVEHGVALYNADPNATDDPEPEPEPEPEPSNTITWELNGGEVNTSSIEVPSQSDLMLQFMNDYVAYFGTPTIDVDAFHPTGNMTGFLYRGKNTREKSVNEMMLDETAGWKWLADYIISTSASNPTIVAALNSGTEVNWRYSIAAFFEQNGSGTYNVDFSTAGQPAAWGSTYQVAHGMVLLPTYVTSAYTLPTPTHPEGLTFLGWYDNPAFSGSSLTIIPAHWTGTLYAQWQENTPTIDPTWQITYTSSNDSIVTPYATDVFGANIVSNEYKDGQGVITFDGSVTSIGEKAFFERSSLTSITIPNSVTSIGNSAFFQSYSLTSITIPNSVTSIGYYAFAYCSSLISITIPNSVTSIGYSAFAYCNQLSSSTIPESVTSIGYSAFAGCTSLTSMVVESGNTTYDSRESCNAIIETATNTLIAGCQNTVIPNSVTSIGSSAFEVCRSLTSITIPNNVTSIGSWAFWGCTSLTSVTIPNSVKSIGGYAFGDCSSLISMVVEPGNTTYDSRESCNAIIEKATNTLIAGCQNTFIPNTVESIGSWAFEGCTSLSSITIPESVKSIGAVAFDDCAWLTSITCEATTPPTLGSGVFPSELTTAYIPCGTKAAYEASDWAQYVSEFVEEDCPEPIDPTWQITYTSTDDNIVTPYKTDVFGANIVSNTYQDGQGVITFDGPVTSIGDYAFHFCQNLASIFIPNSVTSIGSYAFDNCDLLTSVTIGNSVKIIGDAAFNDCSSLTSIAIPNSVTSIHTFAFARCSSLVEIEIPKSVISIGDSDDGRLWACQGIFMGCNNLQKIVVEEGNPIFDSRDNCNAIIETATNTLIAGCPNTEIPNGIKRIGTGAFRDCNALGDIDIPSSVNVIGYAAFYGTGITNVVIPSNCIVEDADATYSSTYTVLFGAFARCEQLTDIVIPEGTTRIASGMLAGCSSLESLTIPASVTSIGEWAFYDCDALTSITIPNGVTSIEEGTFMRCSKLTSITIPSGVTNIGYKAFGECILLSSVICEATTPPMLEDLKGSPVFTSSPICYIPCGTKAAYEASNLAQYVSEFVEEGCSPIQKCGDDLYWEYADGVLTITGTGDMYDYAKDTDVPWYDVRGNIKTVSLPDAMTKIGQNAFYKCTNMTTINMPTSLTAIGEKAFAQDTKLACEIILPASMTTIASRAFFNCKAVPAFHVEATTPPIVQADAFDYTTAPIHVPCGYGHIYGKHTQWGMLNLEMCELLQDNVYYYPIDGHTARAVTYHSNPTDTIVIPSAVVIDGMPRTVTEVADFAFTDCKDIPAIIFNEGLEYIGERAFVRCYGLQGTIVLPATLETIGERAFSYCNNVEKYLIQAMTPPALGANVFTGDNKNALFYISCEAMDDYKVATNWSSLKSRLRDACLNIYHYNTALGANGVHATEDTLVASIYYRRKFTPYRWETLYLPFEVDRVTVLEDGVEYDLTAWDIIDGGHYFLAKPDGMLNKEILFGFTYELESHTPYIIQFSDAYYTDKLITFYGKESWNKLSTSFEVLSSSAWMQIAGNTTLQDQLLEKPVYMLRSGLDFILQKTTTTLHPFECYVMPYTAQSGAPARMNVRLRDDVATAVESVKGNESHLTYSVDGYTLTVYPQGQAFSIYSLNGALIYSCEAGKEAVDCELNSGCYLLHAGTEAHKIML